MKETFVLRVLVVTALLMASVAAFADVTLLNVPYDSRGSSIKTSTPLSVDTGKTRKLVPDGWQRRLPHNSEVARRAAGAI